MTRVRPSGINRLARLCKSFYRPRVCFDSSDPELIAHVESAGSSSISPLVHRMAPPQPDRQHLAPMH